ncbi:ABC transporter ATP-binding protein [Sporomusa aerivorans]|uniref:ABC transporter ATP-binding protein n=1 Tax=Sporomusa aerivorans TaxID=204936 RepID=UPI00352A843C
MSSILAQKLTVAYEENLVVDELDLTLPQGKITAIIGPNGCGKSTILKAVGRILQPRNGTVYLNGKDIRLLSTQEVARKMAILPQSPQAPAGLTVGELVAYGRFPYQRGFGKLNPEDKKIIAWALEMTKLTDAELKVVDTLSGGQRQRVWIAMALAQQTDLILLDEPTTYLDLAYQLEVLELLYRLNREQGSTIVMVLHDLNLAARFADYLVAVRGGRIIRHGTPAEVMTAEVLRETFRIEAKLVTEPRTGRPACVSYDLIK